MIRPADADPAGVGGLLHGFSGGLAFDIGGNVGGAARVLAARFGQVVSCEPCEESYAELADLGLPNVTAVPVAVSDHEGTVELGVQEHPIRSGQLTTGGHPGWGQVIGSRTVPCTTLDALALEFGVPDMVKIDVEAHEVHVIRGGLNVLTGHAPALYIEVHTAELGTEVMDLLSGTYGQRLRTVKHPHYRAGEQLYDSHYWLIAD